jgi:hypothetical protein
LAESVTHFQIFGAGKASIGKETEAEARYRNAAFLTEISNSLAGLDKELESVEAHILASPSLDVERLRTARSAIL